MIPRIVLAVGSNITDRTIEFLKRMVRDESVNLISAPQTETLTLREIVSSLKMCVSGFTSCTKQEEDEDYCDPVAAQRGIDEFSEWLTGRVRQVLQIHVGNPRRPFTIFQPCWSSRRWKSLT